MIKKRRKKNLNKYTALYNLHLRDFARSFNFFLSKKEEHTLRNLTNFNSQKHNSLYINVLHKYIIIATLNY